MQGLFGIAAAVGVAGWALYNQPVTRHYRIRRKDIRGRVRIVQLSDLHNSQYGKGQRRLLKRILQERPDAIVMTGDMYDDKRGMERTSQLLAGLKNAAPLYMVLGNHEYWADNLEQIQADAWQQGVHLLEGNWVELHIRGNRLLLAGASDPMRNCGTFFLPKRFKSLEGQSGCKILLSHRPEPVEIYKQSPFDLVLSGHAHGGQVRIPLLVNGLFAPNQGLFPKYAGGLYQYGKVTHIVSRGLSFYPYLPRIWNPPEVVVLDLEGEGQ